MDLMMAHFIGSGIGALGAVIAAWIGKRNGSAIKEVRLILNGSFDERVKAAVRVAVEEERNRVKNLGLIE